MNKTITLFLLLLIPFVGVGQNLLDNPDFDGDFNNWTEHNIGGSSGYFGSDTNSGTSGSYVLFSNGTYNSHLRQQLNSSDVETADYELSFYAKVNSGGVALNVRPEVYQNGAAIQPGNTSIPADGEWHRVSNVFSISGDYGLTVRTFLKNNVATNSILIDDVKFEHVGPETSAFDFESDEQGWTYSASNTTNFSVAGGIGTIEPLAGASSKITQTSSTLNADNFQYMHILYKNNSNNNNEIRVQFKHEGTTYSNYKGKNVSISTMMSGFEELVIDMHTLSNNSTPMPEWTGIVKDFQILLRDTNNSNNSSAGTFEIEGIAFTDSPALVLSTQDVQLNNFAIYPNPAQNVLNIQAENATEISEVRMYSLLGQEVQRAALTGRNAQVDVSTLRAGMYVVEIDSELGTKVSKFIKR